MGRLSAGTCLVFLLVTSGCGPSSGGTWENDPDNWKRAFRSGQPDDVVVVRSLYWRSHHWSLEFQYFFEIEQNDHLQRQLFAENRLDRLGGTEAMRAKADYFGEPPEWFAPGSIDRYEIYAYEDRPESHFRVFVDRSTGKLFVTDYLV